MIDQVIYWWFMKRLIDLFGDLSIDWLSDFLNCSVYSDDLSNDESIVVLFDLLNNVFRVIDWMFEWFVEWLSCSLDDLENWLTGRCLSDLWTLWFLVMLYRAAPKLKDVGLSESKYRESYLQCVHMMRTMFQECRLVHADLSEFNML